MATMIEDYRVKHDATGDYEWLVVDAEGAVFGEYATKAEAKAEARTMNRDAEIDRLTDAITGRIGDLQNEGAVEALRKIAALMGL